MAQAQGRVTAYVLFLKPAGSSDDWEKNGSLAKCREYPRGQCGR